MQTREELSIIWDYWKPRHTHSWNMFVISSNELQSKIPTDAFETEYAWENYIIRLWLYRTTIRTLLNLHPIKSQVSATLKEFDAIFSENGKNTLKALRDMIEHFDDYASGKGRGPAQRNTDLDPWRCILPDKYERGQFKIDRNASLIAANNLRLNAKKNSAEFITWFHTNKET